VLEPVLFQTFEGQLYCKMHAKLTSIRAKQGGASNV
jgi:hypothetical protein